MHTIRAVIDTEVGCQCLFLGAKQRIASKTIKRYDDPKTPFQRVMESPHIADSVKQNLKEQSLSLNPFLLRKAMELKPHIQPRSATP